MPLKKCCVCGIHKNTTDFYEDKKHKNRLHKCCKKCDTVKKCSICGKIKKLSEFGKSATCINGIRSNCKKCDSIRVAKYRKKKIKEQSKLASLEHEKKYRKEYYKKNKNEIRVHLKNWAVENPEKVKAGKRRDDLKQRTVLSDRYIKRMLCNRSNLKSRDIPQSLVELQREIIKTQRLIKSMSN